MAKNCEFDPHQHVVYRFEQGGVFSGKFLTVSNRDKAASESALAHPEQPVTLYHSTEVMSVREVRRDGVWPWYPPIVRPAGDDVDAEPATPQVEFGEPPIEII